MSGERRQGFPISLCQLVSEEGRERESKGEQGFPEFPPISPSLSFCVWKGGKEREREEVASIPLPIRVWRKESRDRERNVSISK